MKTDYKIGDRVEIVSCINGFGFKKGYIGKITEIEYFEKKIIYNIDGSWWVTAEEIKPATIDLNAKEPFFVTGDVQVWVWDDDPKYAKERYLYFIDNRCNKPYKVWSSGNTMKQMGNQNTHTTGYKNASLTNPNEPEKTIIIEGEEIKLSEKSFNNLRDFFQGLDRE